MRQHLVRPGMGGLSGFEVSHSRPSDHCDRSPLGYPVLPGNKYKTEEQKQKLTVRTLAPFLANVAPAAVICSVRVEIRPVTVLAYFRTVLAWMRGDGPGYVGILFDSALT